MTIDYAIMIEHVSQPAYNMLIAQPFMFLITILTSYFLDVAFFSLHIESYSH